MSYLIDFEPNPTREEITKLTQGIAAYAKEKKGFDPMTAYAFFIRDEQGDVIGGLNGVLFYGCIYIDQLWLDGTIRLQGYGTKLMQAAENYGLEKGATFACVNTMDWEARGFYQKLGYYVELERHGFDKDSTFYFLRKDFNSQFITKDT